MNIGALKILTVPVSGGFNHAFCATVAYCFYSCM